MKRFHHIPLGSLVFLLICSLLANGWLYQRSTLYYRELNQTRLDPLGLQTDWPDNNTTSTAPRVVFFGDSRAAEWPAPSMSDLQFYNRGIGAQTSAQVLGRFEPHIAPLNPTILVLQVGINDLKTIALFPEQQDSIVANCIAQIDAIIQSAHTAGIKVIVTTIFPTGTIPLERQLYWSSAIDHSVQVVNDAIRQREGNGVYLLDTVPLLTGTDGRVRSEYQRDELHLNVAGYTTLNRALVEILGTIPQS